MLIVQTVDNVLLDADPAQLKSSPVTADPTPSQQWRIIETDGGAFLIMNVQTGGLLDVSCKLKDELTALFPGVAVVAECDDAFHYRGHFLACGLERSTRFIGFCRLLRLAAYGIG